MPHLATSGHHGGGLVNLDVGGPSDLAIEGLMGPFSEVRSHLMDEELNCIYRNLALIAEGVVPCRGAVRGLCFSPDDLSDEELLIRLVYTRGL